MKKFILSAAVLLGAVSLASAQRINSDDLPELKFEIVKQNPITSVKDQASSGTCWAFSTIGFVESEIIRINGITDEAAYPDLSEFFVVSHSYSDRADKYIRLDGNLTFSAGSEADDVLHVIETYGMVPQNEMTGMQYGFSLPNQSELDAVLKAYVKAIVDVNPSKLSTSWKAGFQGILDAYLGTYPETFTVDGVEYTPESYRDALKFNTKDYVTLTSFTHHPFYTSFAIEICDNWRWDKAYNVPIDEFMEALDYAIMNGYTASWGSDVSERGFTRDGYAILVDPKAPKAGSDQEHWTGKAADKKASSKKPAKQFPVEIEATQEFRQEGFDRKTLTDDHGMQIFGIAKDQFGHKYYMVKNSWGVTGKFDGIWYATENFVKGLSMDILIHKDAVPQHIAEKLGL